jgi:exopolyphosphatase/guanosine-5'-triphosphate,3'-diphosphate pyrophosphatase
VVEPPLNVGVVDIGTNSMRLLITSRDAEVGRWVEVTGLGSGVDRTGRLSESSIGATLEALTRFGLLMERHGVSRRKAIATSASRDAENRDEFFERAQVALDMMPDLVSGEEEAHYAFEGATTGFGDRSGVVVSDIGGGSTEFVTIDSFASVNIGSVRLTERILTDRPAPREQLDSALAHVGDLFADVPRASSRSIGVAGTWTSLAAIALGLPWYESERVHGFKMGIRHLNRLLDTLGQMTVEETASIPALDPKRAPVILSGAVIAREVLHHLGMDEIMVSERDTLDGVAAELLAD